MDTFVTILNGIVALFNLIGKGLKGLKKITLQEYANFSMIITMIIVLIGIGYQTFGNSGLQMPYLDTTVRFESSQKVSTELLKLRYETGAERAYVAEYHNGKENSTNLPFIYADVTHEEVGNSHVYVSDEYQNMNVSLYTFPFYMADNYYFCGTVDELEAIDPKIAHRFQDNGVKFCAMQILTNKGTIIGILGVSYMEIPTIDKLTIQLKLSQHGQNIGGYLDLREYSK